MKTRYFFDMDGTLAEWREINLKINESEEIANINNIQKRLYDILKSPGYYKTLKPQQEVVDLANKLIDEGKEVFVLSCFIPNSPCVREKKEWLYQYMPKLNVDNQIFIPDGYGEEKHNYIPLVYKAINDIGDIVNKGEVINFYECELISSKSILHNFEKVDTNDILIDDHTPNCIAWEKYENSTAIKLFNDINGKKGNWKGNTLFFDDKNLYDDLINIAEDIDKEDIELEK